MATLIPFPAPRAPLPEPDRIAAFKKQIAEIFASEPGLRKPAAPPRQDEEVLRRLRRIERILSRLATEVRADRAAGSSGTSATPL